MTLSLKQIILFCADVAKLVDFYQSNFGFSIVGEADPNWTVLQTGPIQIGFHKIGEAYYNGHPADFKIEDSNVKLVFELEGGLEALREILWNKGIHIGPIKSFPNYPFLVCDGQDPEGNVFQLMQTI